MCILFKFYVTFLSPQSKLFVGILCWKNIVLYCLRIFFIGYVGVWGMQCLWYNMSSIFLHIEGGVLLSYFLPLSLNMFSYTLYCINNTKTNSRALVFLGNQSVFAPLCTKWMSFAMQAKMKLILWAAIEFDMKMQYLHD